MRAKAPPERTSSGGEERRRALALILSEVVVCTRCPRLVAWRHATALDLPRRYRGEPYWQRPVPGMGDPSARILLVGLAPAAHGGNRTGRVFTGDRSGDVLFAALHRAGLASQPRSDSATDGLVLHDLYVAAVNRCAPPDNRPTPQERDACLPYLVRELGVLTEMSVIVALGAFAWDGALRALAATGHRSKASRPRFGHGAEADVGRYRLLGSFHPSQQNTFTGRLTPAMLDGIFARACELASSTAAPPSASSPIDPGH
ncbi:MAG: uracil-DNA glycosylase [Chloroflexi bacterium]|nr:uracil-DNA glycosylase [Chloroflexota bacterium]